MKSDSSDEEDDKEKEEVEKETIPPLKEKEKPRMFNLTVVNPYGSSEVHKLRDDGTPLKLTSKFPPFCIHIFPLICPLQLQPFTSSWLACRFSLLMLQGERCQKLTSKLLPSFSIPSFTTQCGYSYLHHTPLIFQIGHTFLWIGISGPKRSSLMKPLQR